MNAIDENSITEWIEKNNHHNKKVLAWLATRKRVKFRLDIPHTFECSLCHDLRMLPNLICDGCENNLEEERKWIKSSLIKIAYNTLKYFCIKHTNDVMNANKVARIIATTNELMMIIPIPGVINIIVEYYEIK